MTLDVHAAAVTFSDGTEVEFSPSAVTFIVGANNSGKSRALHDLAAGLVGAGQGVMVVHAVRRAGAGGPAIKRWLEDRGLLKIDRFGNTVLAGNSMIGGVPAVGMPGVLSLTEAIVQLPSTGPLGFIAPMLVQVLGAGERLASVMTQQSFDPAYGQPTSPMQMLQAFPELEQQLSSAAEAAFGRTITLNRVAGPNLRLHVGRPLREPDLLDAGYAEEIASLPSVEEQGDGYKAFIGIMMSVLVAQARILLIDEPEAFLHPPQARRLGREIASRVDDGTQAFIATHSSDVLEGALQAGVDVNVLRITREGAVNRPTMLNTAALRDLWADPLLRYSGALDALFARGLVLCENERDCTFYLAVLDEDEDAPSDHDLEFATVGGKGAIPRVAAAIAALGVPVRAICDIDVLNDELLLDRIVSSLGGSLSEDMRRDLRVIDSAVRGMAETPTVDDLREQLTARLEANEGDQISRQTWNDLQQLTRKPGGWKRLKQGGVALLRGNQHEAATRLIAGLREQGLYVVDKGELEGWVPDAGGKGPDWLPRAFEKGGHLRPEVRAFVRPLAEI